MARYSTTVESAAALAAAPTTFANIVAGASANFKLRRVMIGVRAGATTPTSQQVTVGIARATARGTQTANQAGIAIDPRAAASVITGVDTTWSTPPTVAAAFIAKPTLNTQSMADVPWEFTEELQCDQGTANGIAFQNVGNALPTAHFFVITLEWEE
jgi:hypothetical protein